MHSQENSAAKLAKEARQEILKMTNRAHASHVGSALSCVDILATLYSGIANINLDIITNLHRDIVILSKGHAASALYSVLAISSFFPKNWLESYCQNGSRLGGHVTSHGIPGVELSTGSLGHGAPYGAGIAWAHKQMGCSCRVFVIISDGECDEGTTWEMALFANHHNLNNLFLIIDRNRIQSLKGTEETLSLEPLKEKWIAFGWQVIEVDGHDHTSIGEALTMGSRPTCLIANTIKGKGVEFMENSVLWHYKSPTDEDLMDALELLERD